MHGAREGGERVEKWRRIIILFFSFLFSSSTFTRTENWMHESRAVLRVRCSTMPSSAEETAALVLNKCVPNRTTPCWKCYANRTWRAQHAVHNGRWAASTPQKRKKYVRQTLYSFEGEPLEWEISERCKLFYLWFFFPPRTIPVGSSIVSPPVCLCQRWSTHSAALQSTTHNYPPIICAVV